MAMHTPAPTRAVVIGNSGPPSPFSPKTSRPSGISPTHHTRGDMSLGKPPRDSNQRWGA